MLELSRWKMSGLALLNFFSFLEARAQDLSDCPPITNSTPATDAVIQLTQSIIDGSKAYGPYGKTPECAKDKTDPYDPAYKITYGDYNGQCIDSSTVRPPLVLNQDDKQITIANFYHDGIYYSVFQGKNFGVATRVLSSTSRGVEPLRGKWSMIQDEIERPALQALRDRHIGFTRVQDMNDEMTCAIAEGGCRYNFTLPKPSIHSELF